MTPINLDRNLSTSTLKDARVSLICCNPIGRNIFSGGPHAVWIVLPFKKYRLPFWWGQSWTAADLIYYTRAWKCFLAEFAFEIFSVRRILRIWGRSHVVSNVVCSGKNWSSIPTNFRLVCELKPEWNTCVDGILSNSSWYIGLPNFLWSDPRLYCLCGLGAWMSYYLRILIINWRRRCPNASHYSAVSGS